MVSESEFLFHALLMGVFITFVYDMLRIGRRVFPHNSLLVSLEDMLFWIYCAQEVFLLMYHESNGNLRWFAVAGALAGMLVYKKCISSVFVEYTSRFLNRLLMPFRKLIRCLWYPVRRLADMGKGQMVRMRQRAAFRREKNKSEKKMLPKKRLTVLLKTFKMYL